MRPGEPREPEGVSAGPPPSTPPRILSVIIPVRDEEGSIGATVKAVEAQAPKDATVEVIVVDDGSSDETASVAEATGAGAAVTRS